MIRRLELALLSLFCVHCQSRRPSLPRAPRRAYDVRAVFTSSDLTSVAATPKLVRGRKPSPGGHLAQHHQPKPRNVPCHPDVRNRIHVLCRRDVRFANRPGATRLRSMRTVHRRDPEHIRGEQPVHDLHRGGREDRRLIQRANSSVIVGKWGPCTPNSVHPTSQRCRPRFTIRGGQIRPEFEETSATTDSRCGGIEICAIDASIHVRCREPVQRPFLNAPGEVQLSPEAAAEGGRSNRSEASSIRCKFPNPSNGSHRCVLVRNPRRRLAPRSLAASSRSLRRYSALASAGPPSPAHRTPRTN